MNAIWTWCWLPLLAAVVVGGVSCQVSGAESVLESKITAVSLFKNGLALVERRATPERAGVHQLDAAPTPVHGAVWIEGDRRLAARSAIRPRPRASQPPEHLQQDYAGRTVTVFLQDLPQPISGKVRDFDTAEPPDSNGRRLRSAGGASRFLVLDTGRGESLVDTGRIVHLEVEGASRPVMRPEQVLLLEVPQEAAGQEVVIRYLANGLSWAPSYHVELLSDEQLRVTQQAVVRNELEPLSDARVQLISGFPQVQFRHVTSPLAPGAAWSTFFSQLNQQPGSGDHLLLSNSVVTQQVAMNYRASGGGEFDWSSVPTGEGVDLHYESIGARTLDKGEATQLVVASEEAPYRSVVEWSVPDTRDAYGHRVDHRRQDDSDPWDSLQFSNPLPMPMTTGPATITEAGRFNGQTISHWVSRGESTTLRVTKAASIRTQAVENERAGARDEQYLGGHAYARVTVEGQLTVGNFRAEPVDLLIRRRFSGELLKAEGEPRQQLLEEGVYSVNRRNELQWTFRLAPGEKRQLNYEYRVLVRR